MTTKLYQKGLFILLFMCLILLSTGCDHTELTGTLTLRSNDLMVGEQIPVILTVPNDLSDIHKLLWSVTYDGELEADAPDMIYGGDVLESVYAKAELVSMFGDNYNLDRIAIFVPIKAGVYTIECDGYFKQTNPQPITKITVTIGTTPASDGINASLFINDICLQ